MVFFIQPQTIAHSPQPVLIIVLAIFILPYMISLHTDTVFPDAYLASDDNIVITQEKN